MNAHKMAIYPNQRKTITDIFYLDVQQLARSVSSSIRTQTPGAVFFFLFFWKTAFTTAKKQVEKSFSKKNKKTTKNN